MSRPLILPNTQCTPTLPLAPRLLPPAPENEPSVSTRVIEYVAPALVATLLEPRVPSVHVAQVLHVPAVQNTIEISQLQIDENSWISGVSL